MYQVTNFNVTKHKMICFQAEIVQMGIVAKDFGPLANTPAYYVRRMNFFRLADRLSG